MPAVANRKLRITEMQRLSVEQFHASAKLPLDVVLEDVRSLFNVGSIFRTADAFRVNALHLCGITACPPHPEIHKTALGAEDSVRWAHHPDALDAVACLHRQGYTVLALEQTTGSALLPLRAMPAGPCALVLGNEVHGVSQAVIDLCDGCIEIPQFGTKHSLNVSCAAAIAIWEFASHALSEGHLALHCE